MGLNPKTRLAPEGRHNEQNIYKSTHLVFSTKNREPLVVPDFKSELYAYLGGLTKELNGKAYSIGGIDDHVHMLVNLPPVISISDAMRFLKSNSSG